MERLRLKVVVHILLIKDGKVLLGRRSNTGWRDGYYGTPSGHLENNETLIEAAVREVKEETGVIVKPEDLKHVHTMHRKSTYIDFFFEATAWEGEPHIMEKDLCDDMQWFSLHELTSDLPNGLPQNIISSVKSTLKHYQEGVRFSEFEGE